jgi:hypothetical protein
VKALLAGFALWLLILTALFCSARVEAGVFFMEADGGWTEWLPDGGSRRGSLSSSSTGQPIRLPPSGRTEVRALSSGGVA